MKTVFDFLPFPHQSAIYHYLNSNQISRPTKCYAYKSHAIQATQNNFCENSD